MIIDGKFIEENSIPLNRLNTTVVSWSSYNSDAEALNTRIGKIENLQMASNDPLQAFNTTTVNHFATKINDTSTASAPAHTIKDGTVTDAMLATALKNKLVYTDVNKTITATDTFTGLTTFTASSTSNDILKVTKGITTLQATAVKSTLTVDGASTLKSISGTTLSLSGTDTALSVSGNASIAKKLTVKDLEVTGTSTVVNSTDLQVKDMLISLNEGGSAPVAGSSVMGILIGTSGITSNVNAVKLARLTYKGDGWYVRNHSTSNTAQTESKIVTEAYLTAQGFQTTSNLEAQIKTVMKKYIARGSVTLAGTTGVLVDLTASKYATFAANISGGDSYDVFVTLVTPNTGNAGTTMSTGATSVGEIQVVKTDTKKFKIFNSGTASSMYVHWMAVNRALMTA